MRCAVLVGLGLVAATPASAAETRAYVVRGASAAELIEQMKKLGPNGYWAWTQARYSWTYSYRQSGGRCSIESATVNEQITVTVPEWQNRAAGKQCLREGWDRMLARLSEHEQGHVTRWTGTKEQVHAALLATPADASCDAVGRAANAAGNAVIEKIQASQQEYDRQTNHGLSSGVALREC